MDRISCLPDFIIHHIMSYLSAKEVVQTSILSKKWNHLWKSLPILDFDQSNFVGEHVNYRNFCLRRKNKRFRKRTKKFIKFVDVSLLRFCQLKFCIQKFRLFISLLSVKRSSSLVDKWIGLAVENEVKELDFEVLTGSYKAYTLPPTIFSAKSMTTLKLVGCRLEQPSNIIRLDLLKKLTLDRVCVDEQMVKDLSSKCPLLEDLCLSSCRGLKHLCVSKALNLKIMEVDSPSDIELESIEISAPSLQELTLKSTQLQRPQVIDLAGCPHLKKLSLMGVNLRDQEFHQIMSKVPFLEDLFLFACDFLKRVAISSNWLRRLELSCCNNLKALDVDTPNLLSFIYENNPISTSCINAPCPWKVYFRSEIEFETEWCLNLRDFLGVSNKIEDLTIFLLQNMSSFNSDEFRESCPSLPCHVGNLDVCIDVPPSDYMVLFDGLLWICYPKTLSVQTLKDPQHELFEWLYNKLRIEDVNCCNSHHIKCWRHYLKDMKIDSFVRYEDKKCYNRDDLMKLLNIDNLENVWSILPKGELRFHLDWCFPILLEEA